MRARLRSDSHTATGTGFLIGAGGLMLTNYHVVADKALEPQTYRLELVRPNGRRSALRILALDVVHDLAVVQGEVGHAKPLSFVASQLSKGDKVFSLGYFQLHRRGRHEYRAFFWHDKLSSTRLQ